MGKYQDKRGEIEVRVLKDKCIGAAVCAVIAEKTFTLEDNIAVLKEGEWDEFEKILEAAKGCPVFAIEVYKNGKKVFPED